MTERTTHYRTCPLCEATCGLELTLEGSEVVRIRGDRDDVLSRGFICPKGSALHRLHADPDRLAAPRLRSGPAGAEASWTDLAYDAAFAFIDERLRAVVDRYGRDAVAVYLGNPNAHNHASTLYIRPLLKALGTKNLFSASTVDQMPKHVSSGLLFGNPLNFAVPDVDRTDHLLVLGADPWESNGSLATAPDFPGRITAMKERGGRLVVVDPRRSRTAQEADEHVAIRPGGDAHLLLAMIHTLFDEDLVETGRLGPHLDGLDRLRAAVAPFTADAVTGITGLDAETARRMAREVAAAPTAAIYGRIGTHTVRFGTVAAWAVDVIAALTGNLDEPGGNCFARPAHARPDPPAPGGRGFSTGRWDSRVNGHPEVLSEFPVAGLADEILTPGEGRVRALLVIGGNPARSTPDTARLEEALADLELLISVDPYLNETSRFADVILPTPTPLERSQYDLALYNALVHNVANYSPPLFEPALMPEHEILARLTLIAGGQGADADPALVDDLVVGGLVAAEVGRVGSPIEGRDADEILEQLGDRPGPDRALDVMIRVGPYGDGFGARPGGLSLDELEAHPHGVDLGPLDRRLPAMLKTASGRVELLPGPIEADLGPAAAALADGGNGVVLIGRRQLRSNNSWMHNIEVLVKGKERCTLLVHPDDAASYGLTDGGAARVTSKVGELVAPVEVSDAIRPGVVSLPHGWGHDAEGAELGVAARYAGVNSNVLTDPSAIDALSGNAVLNGIPVSLAPA